MFWLRRRKVRLPENSQHRSPWSSEPCDPALKATWGAPAAVGKTQGTALPHAREDTVTGSEGLPVPQWLPSGVLLQKRGLADPRSVVVFQKWRGWDLNLEFCQTLELVLFRFWNLRGTGD